MNKTTILIIIIVVIIFGIGGLLFLYFQKTIVPIQSIPPINTPPLELYNINNALNSNQGLPDLNLQIPGGQTPTINTNNTDFRPVSVSISNFTFNPTTTTVKIGATVTWINDDPAPHTISGTGFNSSILNTGDSFSYTFNQAGAFDYSCSLHPSMNGQIIVQ